MKFTGYDPFNGGEDRFWEDYILPRIFQAKSYEEIEFLIQGAHPYYQNPDKTMKEIRKHPDFYNSSRAQFHPIGATNTSENLIIVTNNLGSEKEFILLSPSLDYGQEKAIMKLNSGYFPKAENEYILHDHGLDDDMLNILGTNKETLGVLQRELTSGIFKLTENLSPIVLKSISKTSFEIHQNRFSLLSEVRETENDMIGKASFRNATLDTIVVDLEKRLSSQEFWSIATLAMGMLVINYKLNSDLDALAFLGVMGLSKIFQR